MSRIDDLGRSKFALDLQNAAFDKALLVLRGLVLSVLREVTLGPGLGDGLDYGVALNRLQAMQFRFK